MSNASTLELFARLALSLGVVIALMWAVAAVLRRRGFGAPVRPGAARGGHIELLARRSLGRNASIAVVRAGGRDLVLGITDHQVTKLDDADVDDVDLGTAGQWTGGGQGPVAPGSAWKAMLEHVRERTIRR
jgi:flagellar biosynthetic protein FliO